jgi:hypothetical protein
MLKFQKQNQVKQAAAEAHMAVEELTVIAFAAKAIIRNGGTALASQTTRTAPLSVVCAQFGHFHILQNFEDNAPT